MHQMIGQHYGRLTVAFLFERRGTHNYWACNCECGGRKVVRQGHLKSGGTRSCGCLHDESAARPKTHGLSNTVEYKTWKEMIKRCNNRRHLSYPTYGGRGIRVCDEWRRDFIAFLSAVGRKPTPQHSLDRINPDGHYEPGNVRWATSREQQNNRRGNVLFKIDGQMVPRADAARLLGVAHSQMRSWQRLGLLRTYHR